MAESPTIEKPEAPEKPAVETPAATQPDSDVSALIDELKKMNVKSPEDLRNKDVASKQAGRLAQELGEVRKANQQLLQMVQELKTSKPAVQQDPYNQNNGESIDLGKLIEEKAFAAVERGLTRVQQRQLEAQRAVQAEMARIKNHPRYSLVESVFPQHLNREEVQAALLAGETTLVDEFDRVRTEMENQMFKRFEGVLSKTPKATPPHVEQGGERSIPTPPATEEYKKKLRQIDEDRSKGRLNSDAALDAIIKSVLG